MEINMEEEKKVMGVEELDEILQVGEFDKFTNDKLGVKLGFKLRTKNFCITYP